LQRRLPEEGAEGLRLSVTEIIAGMSQNVIQGGHTNRDRGVTARKAASVVRLMHKRSLINHELDERDQNRPKSHGKAPGHVTVKFPARSQVVGLVGHNDPA
jgi:hypothetical protein